MRRRLRYPVSVAGPKAPTLLLPQLSPAVALVDGAHRFIKSPPRVFPSRTPRYSKNIVPVSRGGEEGKAITLCWIFREHCNTDPQVGADAQHNVCFLEPLAAGTPQAGVTVAPPLVRCCVLTPEESVLKEASQP